MCGPCASCNDLAAASTLRLLLDAGADVNALDNDGRSPLRYAMPTEMRALPVARGGV